MLTNRDLAPVPPAARTWTAGHFAALWVAMSVCIPTYMLASSMVQSGMSWRAGLAAVFLGNAVVLVPMLANAHAGAKYGIPFPVYARASFGVRGAHVATLSRAAVACGWFGIQTWIGGLALSALIGFAWPGWKALGGQWSLMGYGLPLYLGFLLFWLANMFFAWTGTESIKWLESLAAPFLIVMGIALLAWVASQVGGVHAILAGADRLQAARPPMSTARFLATLFVPWLTAMVGFWATLALNIPDFSRYARSQRDQAVGQTVGLLTTMPLFAFIGIAVTSATLLLYGEAIWNPIDLVARITGPSHPGLGALAMFAIVLATLSTNIAANVVAPANTFSNLAPERIDFRTGGLIAGILGIVIVPWKLLDAYQAWLLGYSGLLGAVGGVLLADYLVVRRTQLSVDDLYREDGMYAYGDGIHGRAIAALAAGVGMALIGLLDPDLRFLFDGAWFSAGITSFVVYVLLARG